MTSNAFATAFPLPECQHQSPAVDDGEQNDEQIDEMDGDELHQLGECLQQLHANFNPESVRKSSKAQDTFTKHQNHNKRFILNLFEKEEYHAYLEDEFLRELEDINIEPDCSSVVSKHPT